MYIIHNCFQRLANVLRFSSPQKFAFVLVMFLAIWGQLKKVLPVCYSYRPIFSDYFPHLSRDDQNRKIIL